MATQSIAQIGGSLDLDGECWPITETKETTTTDK